MILYVIVNRGYPFAEGSNMWKQQMAHRFRFGSKMSFKPDQHLKDLLYRVLEPNVKRRIKMNELMAHPWISQQVLHIENNTGEAANRPADTTPTITETAASATEITDQKT